MPSDLKSLILRDPEVVAVLAGRATVRRKLKIPAKMLREWNEGASFVPGCVRETRTAHEVLVHFAGDHGWDVVSCPVDRSLSTSLVPTKPVPPITAVFILVPPGGVTCDPDRRSARSRLPPGLRHVGPGVAPLLLSSRIGARRPLRTTTPGRPT